MKKYLMITDFDYHWKDGQKTRYTTNYVSDEVKNNLQNNQTLFVKIDKQGKIEKVFEGSVHGISSKDNKIFFSVSISNEVTNFRDLNIELRKPFWRFYEESSELNSSYEPPFFKELLKTTEWQFFEDETYKLLKLLGINNVFKFVNQRGEADGFFKVGNLAVLYDTTLDEHFEQVKSTQIDNFCSQLEKGLILIDEQNTMQTFHHCQKDVWIITKGSTRVIKTFNDISIKEIAIDDLMKLYHERLDSQFTAITLEDRLRTIGS